MNTKKKISIIILIIVVLAALASVVLVVSSRSGSKSIQENLDLGAKYLDELDYDKALAAYQAVLEIEPNNVEAHLGIVAAYVGQGDYESALEQAKEGYELTGDERLKAQMETVERLLAEANAAVEEPEETSATVEEVEEPIGTVEVVATVEEPEEPEFVEPSAIVLDDSAQWLIDPGTIIANLKPDWSDGTYNYRDLQGSNETGIFITYWDSAPFNVYDDQYKTSVLCAVHGINFLGMYQCEETAYIYGYVKTTSDDYYDPFDFEGYGWVDPRELEDGYMISY